MNHRVILAFILSIISTLLSAQTVFKNIELEAKRIAEGVIMIETTDGNTLYLIEGNKRALLIDTGAKLDSLDRVIAHLTSLPYEVVLTHYHGDHAGNVHYFKKVYLHPSDTTSYFEYNPRTPDVKLIHDGSQFDLGNRRIGVLHTPGHTPGCIVLFDFESKIAFTGDGFGSNHLWLQMYPHVPMSTFIASCTKMEKAMKNKGIKEIYCGHFPHMKKVLSPSYIGRVKALAIKIQKGDITDAKPYDIPKSKRMCDNPLVIADQEISIVFDPIHCTD